MVTDEQVRRLRKLSNTEKNQEIAASKAGMDPTTARRYLGLERLPSELKKERSWRERGGGAVVGRGRICFARYGMPFSGRSRRVPGWRPRPCLSGYSGNIQGGSVTGRSEHCNGGSNYGG